MEDIIYFLLNFFIYGVIGWIIENVYCYYINGHFQEDGFLNGPFKPMYGITMALLIQVESKINNYFFIILCLIIPTVVEYITGYFMKKYFNKIYWNYSNEKLNFDGIICLKFSLYWTLLTYIGVKYFQRYIIENFYYYISNISIYIVLLCIFLWGIDEILSLKKYILELR